MPACQQKAALMSETRFVMVYAYDIVAEGATGLDHSRVVGGPPLPEPADYWLL